MSTKKQQKIQMKMKLLTRSVLPPLFFLIFLAPSFLPASLAFEALGFRG